MCSHLFVCFSLQSFGLASTPGTGVASVSEETQELLARVAELQQDKWNLEEKVWREREREREREGGRGRGRDMDTSIDRLSSLLLRLLCCY